MYSHHLREKLWPEEATAMFFWRRREFTGRQLNQRESASSPAGFQAAVRRFLEPDTKAGVQRVFKSTVYRSTFTWEQTTSGASHQRCSSAGDLRRNDARWSVRDCEHWDEIIGVHFYCDLPGKVKELLKQCSCVLCLRCPSAKFYFLSDRSSFAPVVFSTPLVIIISLQRNWKKSRWQSRLTTGTANSFLCRFDCSPLPLQEATIADG